MIVHSNHITILSPALSPCTQGDTLLTNDNFFYATTNADFSVSSLGMFTLGNDQEQTINQAIISPCKRSFSQIKVGTQRSCSKSSSCRRTCRLQTEQQVQSDRFCLNQDYVELHKITILYILGDGWYFSQSSVHLTIKHDLHPHSSYTICYLFSLIFLKKFVKKQVAWH